MPAYATCPRLLGEYLQNITGVITGSDTKHKGKYSGKLCWITHTRFPEFIGHKRLTAEKVILVVQNPLDCILKNFTQLTGKIPEC